MTRADRARRRAAASVGLAALVLATALTGCESGDADTAEPTGGSSSTSSGSPDAPDAPATYVALGDSYTAAPFVPTTDIAAGCFRSTGNYPTLVSSELAPGTFVDVSCGGADSTDLLEPQSVAGGDATVPAQLDALRPDADLVTVGIGGNDGNLFSRLVCSFTQQRPTQCSGLRGTANSEETLATTRDDVTTALRAVVSRAAPDALVLLVGYPRLVDPSRACPSLPLRRKQQQRFAIVEQRLRTTLRTAADSAGAEFLDLWPESRGHEICSDDPWINGKDTDRARALAYHPFAAEQEAVAELVAQRWRER